MSNSITTKEDQLLKSNLIKDWRNGMRHSVPVSATFSLFNYINITPQFNFTDRMYSHKVMKHWDAETQREVNDTVWGFRNVYNYDMSVSATTKLYGFLYTVVRQKDSDDTPCLTPTVSFSLCGRISERHVMAIILIREDGQGRQRVYGGLFAL